jgi:2-dehydropantoate 2-reductase
LEIEALIGSVIELGRLTDTPAPSIEAVYACTKLLNRSILKQQAGVTFQSAAQ